MRKFIATLFIVAASAGLSVPHASAICYDRVLRNGTILHECR